MPLPKKKSASKTSKAGASGAKNAPVPKAGSGAKPKSAAKKTAVNQKSAAGKKTAGKKASAKLNTATASKKVSASRLGSHDKADSSKPEPADSSKESTGLSHPGAESVSKAATKSPVTAKKKSHEPRLADSINQGLAKQGQKKRGWRDIEALTERARLKNLLSDIWHEDIDLDSEIFGGADQFSSYYTDKEEEIDVEDDEDDEWEEFEEDEN